MRTLSADAVAAVTVLETVGAAFSDRSIKSATFSEHYLSEIVQLKDKAKE